MSTPNTIPSVLFVCVKNGGKSQMAAALMRRHAEQAEQAGHPIEVYSAGTKPGTAINQLSAEVIAEVGAGMAAEVPQPIDPDLLAKVDRVVVLGNEARVEPVEKMTGTIETWSTGEPSERGIEGLERMRLVRDDIDSRVQQLVSDLLDTTGSQQQSWT